MSNQLIETRRSRAPSVRYNLLKSFKLMFSNSQKADSPVYINYIMIVLIIALFVMLKTQYFDVFLSTYFSDGSSTSHRMHFTIMHFWFDVIFQIVLAFTLLSLAIKRLNKLDSSRWSIILSIICPFPIYFMIPSITLSIIYIILGITNNLEKFGIVHYFSQFHFSSIIYIPSLIYGTYISIRSFFDGSIIRSINKFKNHASKANELQTPTTEKKPHKKYRIFLKNFLKARHLIYYILLLSWRLIHYVTLLFICLQKGYLL